MEITLKMDNLANLVERTINENLENIIKTQVDAMISDSIQKSKDTISERVNEKVSAIVDEYISNATISVGGGWKEEPKTYTIEEYIKAEIADRIESGKFLVKDRYNSNTYKTFTEFITDKFNVDAKIEKELTSFMTQVQKDIDKNVADMFNATTQAALSSSILNLLMQNDTFLNMQDSVKRITSRE